LVRVHRTSGDIFVASDEIGRHVGVRLAEPAVLATSVEQQQGSPADGVRARRNSSDTYHPDQRDQEGKNRRQQASTSMHVPKGGAR
jgi:hypothetical protein